MEAIANSRLNWSRNGKVKERKRKLARVWDNYEAVEDLLKGQLERGNGAGNGAGKGDA